MLGWERTAGSRFVRPDALGTGAVPPVRATNMSTSASVLRERARLGGRKVAKLTNGPPLVSGKATTLVETFVTLGVPTTMFVTKLVAKELA